jgi:hypothetical protein
MALIIRQAFCFWRLPKLSGLRQARTVVVAMVAAHQ